MSKSGSFTTTKVCPAGGNTWWFEFNWSVSSWSGNTATISYNVYCRCSYSGTSYTSNYGFTLTINGSNKTSSSRFDSNKVVVSGTLTLSRRKQTISFNNSSSLWR